MKSIKRISLLLLIISFFFCYFFVTLDLQRTYHFAGDQGTNATIIRNIHDNHEYPLLGPHSNFGGHYFGPFYYYFLFIPYLAFDFDPVAGGYFIAFFNMLGYLSICWYAIKELKAGCSPVVAFVALCLIPSLFWVGRTQWNPNLLPGVFCFLLLSILYYFNSSRTGAKLFFSGCIGFWTAAAIQLHTSTYCLVIPVFLLLLFETFQNCKNARSLKRSMASMVVCGMVMALLFLPSLVEGMQNNFENIRRYISFIAQNSARDPYSWKNVISLGSLYFSLWKKAFGPILGMIIFFSVFPLVPLLQLIRFSKGKADERQLVFCLFPALCVLFSFWGFLNYKGQVHNYFLTVLYVVPIISLMGIPLLSANKNHRTVLGILAALIIGVTLPNYVKADLGYLENRPHNFCHYREFKQIVNRIISDAAKSEESGFGFCYFEGKRADPRHYIYMLEHLKKGTAKDISYENVCFMKAKNRHGSTKRVVYIVEASNKKNVSEINLEGRKKETIAEIGNFRLQKWVK